MEEPTAASGPEPSPGPAEIVAEPAPMAVTMIAASIGGSSDADAPDADGHAPEPATGDPGTRARPEPAPATVGEGTRAETGAAGAVTPDPPLDQTAPDRLDADDLEALARPDIVGAGANDERDQTDQMTLF